MLEFIKNRTVASKRVQPSIQEIQILEVYKKLTESGWIVKESEIKQTLQFLDINREDVESDKQLSTFILKLLEVIGSPVSIHSLKRLFSVAPKLVEKQKIFDQTILEQDSD